MRSPKWALATLAGAATLAAGADRASAQAPPAQPAQPPAAAAPAQPKAAALINGEPITLAEIDAVINRGGPKAVQPSAEQTHNDRLEALSMLIDDLLLQQFLKTSCQPPDPKEINKKMSGARREN